MQAPRIHLNGTSRERLEQQFEQAGRALSVALEALNEAAPNARDYYVIDSTAFSRAVKEHQARLLAVQGVREEIQALYESLYEGDNAGAR